MFVYSEDIGIACELVSGARILAGILGAKIVACVPEAPGAGDALFAHGADRVILLKNLSNLKGCDSFAKAIERVVRSVNPKHVLVGGTKPGKEVGAYLAVRLGSGCISEVKKASVKDGRVVVTRSIYGGRFVAEISTGSSVGLLIVAPHAFEKSEAKKTGAHEIIDVSDIVPRIKLVSAVPEPKTDVNLAAAPVVVCVGRGLKKKEDLPMVQELAKALNGPIGCTRPLSQDLNWFPSGLWIGLSGVKIKPKLYITAGVSGQIQHVAGITDSKIIVAINNNPKAPIFESCDYCIAGDMYKVIPELTKRMMR